MQSQTSSFALLRIAITTRIFFLLTPTRVFCRYHNVDGFFNSYVAELTHRNKRQGNGGKSRTLNLHPWSPLVRLALFSWRFR